MIPRTSRLVLGVGCLAVLLGEVARADDRDGRGVVGLFERRCLKCHHEGERKGGLSLQSAAGLSAGGDSGPAVVPGDAAGSLLYDMIAGESPEMPRSGAPLSLAEVAIVERWIQGGARWPDGITLRVQGLPDNAWWSLRPLVRPPVPALDASAAAQARTAVDAFILDRLCREGWQLSPEADRRTQIRRLGFDLLGLPPDPAQIEAFVADPDPLAYEKLVDRLLSSPRYGERWARHWLDVVHYGDTHGYDKDKLRPHAWPYRDYVIRAWNEDKPYDRFVHEQLAGDVLWPDTVDGLVATGFIAAGPWDFIGHAEVPETKIDGKVARHLDRDDMVTATMNTFLSLTVQCAQCHDHKFDPVGQEHYYSLQAVFAALDRADRVFDADPEVRRKRQEWTEQQAALTARRGETEARVRELAGAPLKELDQQLSASPPVSADERSRLTAARQRLIDAATPPTVRQELEQIAERLAELARRIASLPSPQVVYCGCVHAGSGNFIGTGKSGGTPREIRVLVRGNVQQPGKPVEPGTVPILPGIDWQFALPAGHREGDRRVALARWITRQDNPLTWRSIANRVWQYHFGRGIVDSPNDFGRMGELPSHPELLDWLAAEFRDGRRSFKDLHRQILCSATYRQASRATRAAPEYRAARQPHEGDAENRLLWRMNRRKLEAEAVRDAVLSVAGRLDERMYGPAFQDFVIERPEHSPHFEYGKHDPGDVRTHRRSIYRFLVRSQPEPFMNTLDCADPSQMVDKRNETLTALQALALMNNKFMLRMSQHFADRLETAGPQVDVQVEWAYRWALGRPPQPAEQEDVCDFARQFGMANACRAIFNLNEFVFVD